MSLPPTQLTAIDQHLRKENWLLNEDLISELTDHYINGISDRLAQGMPFDVAVREIHAGFGGRKGLLKMEEDFHVSQTKNNGRIVKYGSTTRPTDTSASVAYSFTYYRISRI